MHTEIMAIYSKIQLEHTDAVYKQNTQLLQVWNIWHMVHHSSSVSQYNLVMNSPPAPTCFNTSIE